MKIEEALKEIERIAERYDRDMRLCETAARIERERQKRTSEDARASTEAGAGS